MCDSEFIERECYAPQGASCCRPVVRVRGYAASGHFKPIITLPPHDLVHHSQGEMQQCPRCAIYTVLKELSRYLSDEGEGGELFPKIGIEG